MRRLHETCTVEGCSGTHKARGYCQTHYMQYKRGVPVTPEIRHRVPRGQVLPECSEAGCSASVKAHGLCHAHYQRLLRQGHTRYRDRTKPAKTCSEPGCEKILYAKGLCHQHSAYKRKLAQYGLTPENYADLQTLQGGACAICNGPERASAPDGNPKQLAVDHCHVSGQVRALLCSSCNRGLGLFQDDPVLLRKAAEYLLAHASPV